ncbi:MULTISPECIES: MlaD family protein [Flavobacterium]|uniref:MCE family protein n=1 Tax=Flavobacterium gawalongense TaxID=2594432 RepID=A0A553BLF5_9FLAO|nr:MlaD family protein [Flavobacterium gawalongense]TRX00842.1 MCE family protein [Flavobacterium gawalongense]TRX05143.1 MCE family protein [Flavobacterium gawalongense]TRX09078.1 MCE family protein [Flavobacterium gawalongense]TRX10213.1 MCE family protein [Flavobacterium gawalongense]TRX27119.1 MCE family protein [Flavobacterium gawalongense]
MKITREIKTAILVIASILLFIWGYSFLKGRDLFTNYKTFYVEYESVEGLATSAPVTLNGLVIGKVNSITINENTGILLVELQLKTDFPISKSSTASIYEPGFIGGKQIAINPNFNDKTLAVDGQKLQGTTKLGLTDKVGDKLAPLQEKLEKIMANTDKLLSGINNVLDKNGQENLKVSLAELSKTIEQFHKATVSVNTLLDDNKAKIEGAVTNFNKISGDFSKISDSLSKADLGKTVKNLNKTLARVDGIMSGLESGKGSMGKLLNDEAFYENIKATTRELELLLQDIRLSPTRYVNVSLFGKKNKPYVAPINDSIIKEKN